MVRYRDIKKIKRMHPIFAELESAGIDLKHLAQVVYNPATNEWRSELFMGRYQYIYAYKGMSFSLLYITGMYEILGGHMTDPERYETFAMAENRIYKLFRKYEKEQVFDSVNKKNEKSDYCGHDDRTCQHCGFPIRIRNLSGFCDHLYYPDYCETCKAARNDEERENMREYQKEKQSEKKEC